MKEEKMKKPVTIYCFTGTGNTLIASRAMKREFESAGVVCNVVPLERADPATVPQDHCIGVACPAAVFSTFPIVWRFLEGLPRAQGKDRDFTPFFLLVTMANTAGGLLVPVRRIIEKKGYRALGAKKLRMPSNMFVRPAVAKEELSRTSAEAEATQFARGLTNETAAWDGVPVVGDVIGFASKLVVKKLWPNSFCRKFFSVHVTDACIGCGLCVKVCPVQAARINPDTGRAEFESTCEYCFRCAGVCPSKAIKIKGHPKEPYCALPQRELIEFTSCTLS